MRDHFITMEGWEELAKRLLRKRTRQAARDFLPSVRPMYRNSDAEPRPAHCGSCVLLNVGGVPILATAAHVLDNITEGYTLYVGGAGDAPPVRIRGGLLGATPKPESGRRHDRFDCGFWRVSEEALREMGAVEFVDASRLSDIREGADRRYFMAMGYRLAANKKEIDHRTKMIRNRLSCYSGSVVEMPMLAEKLGISGEQHMFVSFPKYGQDENDRRVKTFGPVGISGGPLLDLGDFTLEHAYAPDATHRASLCGMMIEQHSEFQAMVAVRISYIVEGIKSRLGQ